MIILAKILPYVNFAVKQSYVAIERYSDRFDGSYDFLFKRRR